MRDPCSCDALWHERHREGCPRRNDRSKTEDIKAALHRRHPAKDGEWVSWPEVFSIDVFAMRFWRSGIGTRRVAYEVKTSRADFLAEIRKPEKRARALELSHQFFFATPKGLVKPEEIPSDSGLVEVDEAGKSRVRVKAPLRHPRWFTEEEVSSLLRMDLFRSDAGRLLTRLQTAESRVEGLAALNDEMRSEMELADRKFARLLGEQVQPGTRWCGQWLYYGHRQRPESPEMVEVEVTEVRRGGWVSFGRVDGAGDYHAKDERKMGEFLRCFDLVREAAA